MAWEATAAVVGSKVSILQELMADPPEKEAGPITLVVGCGGRDKIGSPTCRVPGGGGRSKVNVAGGSGPVTAIDGEHGDGGVMSEVVGRDGDDDGKSPGVGEGAVLRGGEHSMMGVFFSPSGTIPLPPAVAWFPTPAAIHEAYLEIVPGDDGTGSIRVALDASRAIVIC